MKAIIERYTEKEELIEQIDEIPMNFVHSFKPIIKTTNYTNVFIGIEITTNRGDVRGFYNTEDSIVRISIV